MTSGDFHEAVLTVGKQTVDRRTFIAAVALWAAMPPLAAAQGAWILLGSRTVNWAARRGSITPARTWPPVNALSFRARGGRIFITDVEVSYARGGRDRLPVNTRLDPNVRSHAFRLRNPDRIHRIDFAFRPVRRGVVGTALEVFGRR